MSSMKSSNVPLTYGNAKNSSMLPYFTDYYWLKICNEDNSGWEIMKIDKEMTIS